MAGGDEVVETEHGGKTGLAATGLTGRVNSYTVVITKYRSLWMLIRVPLEVLLDPVVFDEEGAADEVTVESLDHQGSVGDSEVVSAKVLLYFPAG